MCANNFFLFLKFITIIRFYTPEADHSDSLVVSYPAYRENKPQKGGICVANHTSPIDVVILANDGCYAMVSIAKRWVSLPPMCFDLVTSPLCASCLTGGADPRGSDGGDPAVDGEVVPSCLVWEVWNERQTRCDQQVRPGECKSNCSTFTVGSEGSDCSVKQKKEQRSTHDCFLWDVALIKNCAKYN